MISLLTILVFYIVACKAFVIENERQNTLNNNYNENDNQIHHISLLDFLPDDHTYFNSIRNKQNPASTINGLCLLQNCALSVLKGAFDYKFRQEAKCQMGCIKLWDTEKDPEKYTYQNCTTICARTYESDAGDKLLTCAMNKKCLQFGKINVTCPKEQLTAAVKPGSSLRSLQGEWWQAYGKNKLFDCYPCQHIHGNNMVKDVDWCKKTVTPLGPRKAPCYNYTYSYDVYLSNNKLSYYQQSWQLPGPTEHTPGKPVDIFYNYLGSNHNETWYIFDYTDRYVQLGYCSYMNGWTNVGSILWVKGQNDNTGITLTKSEKNEIKSIYKQKMNWDFDDFCETRHGVDGQCEGLDHH